MPIHVAITRRVRPGCEAEFQAAVREFFRASYAHEGVHGVQLLSPAPESGSRDYGILRTFASAEDRDAFYASAAFAAWNETASRLTEGETTRRELHGLEAWFHSAEKPPPRWKMATLTFVGVYAVTFLLSRWLSPALAGWPMPLAHAVFNLVVVALLTWAVMPTLIRLAHSWLKPSTRPRKDPP